MTTKPALQSTAILGGLLAIIPNLSNMLGYNIAGEDITNIINGTAATIGGLMAIYGRLKATDKISGVLPAKSGKPATYSAMRTVVAKKRGRPAKKR